MIKLIALLKRKPELSREEFARRWVEEHTKISARLPGLIDYRINIAIPEQEITGELPYDGTAELWFESVEAMRAAFASEIGQAAGADGDLFAAVRLHIYTEEHIIKPVK
ncbi:MAG: EthD family reductase [Chloroflexi bacterium]|nr:EthD family reductase [Chloroflexota bacterium]MDL1882313.1 EthD family reductase [Anaerolineae bacterium CFX8]GIL13038.1 MAG: hypothetical protein BroJett038_17580 [Chloroflexota bacterium]